MEQKIIVVGAGAAGLMCGISAAERGLSVTVLDHANKAGKKILISGGGRCNFTNIYTDYSNFLSENDHFCKSALKRYTPWDFVKELDDAGVTWHEKTQGQLFSDKKSHAILALLLHRCQTLGVDITLNCSIDKVCSKDGRFEVSSSHGAYSCNALVIATGGMSFPSMGASDFGHRIARQFDMKVTHTKPALVPLTLDDKTRERFSTLAGISVEGEVRYGSRVFQEGILFTHKGVSGPAILQISSFWQSGKPIVINLLPQFNLHAELSQIKKDTPNKHLHKALGTYFPSRLVACFCQKDHPDKPLQFYSDRALSSVANTFHQWTIRPTGTEGYKKAEVTLGGVDTSEISSRTFESKKVKNLFFIGETLDVTGHLGGFNFQWAWASGHCCGQEILKD